MAELLMVHSTAYEHIQMAHIQEIHTSQRNALTSKFAPKTSDPEQISGIEDDR